jgi:hypothetical protein
MTLQIEVGKRYKTRAGAVALVVGKNPNPKSLYPFVFMLHVDTDPNTESVYTCSAHGSVGGTGAPLPNDLVAEYVEPFAGEWVVIGRRKNRAEFLVCVSGTRDKADRDAAAYNNDTIGDHTTYRAAFVKETQP